MSLKTNIRLLKWWGGRRPGMEFPLMNFQTAKLLIDRGIAEEVLPLKKKKAKRKAKPKVESAD